MLRTAIVGTFALSCVTLSSKVQEQRHGTGKVVFSEYIPDNTVKLDGIRLRAANLALRHFLPEPRKATTCFDRADSYDVTVWKAEASPPGSRCPEGSATCAALYGTPGLVYVEIDLRPGACDDGSEVVLDEGATYAIDVSRWRIVASRR